MLRWITGVIILLQLSFSNGEKVYSHGINRAFTIELTHNPDKTKDSHKTGIAVRQQLKRPSIFLSRQTSLASHSNIVDTRSLSFITVQTLIIASIHFASSDAILSPLGEP